jgi:hypothetical protein
MPWRIGYGARLARSGVSATASQPAAQSTATSRRAPRRTRDPGPPGRFVHRQQDHAAGQRGPREQAERSSRRRARSTSPRSRERRHVAHQSSGRNAQERNPQPDAEAGQDRLERETRGHLHRSAPASSMEHALHGQAGDDAHERPAEPEHRRLQQIRGEDAELARVPTQRSTATEVRRRARRRAPRCPPPPHRAAARRARPAPGSASGS